MKKSNFLEGFIIGAVVSIVGWELHKRSKCCNYILNNEHPDIPCTESSERPGYYKASSNFSSDVVIDKTLSAIEKGFEQLASIIDKRKRQNLDSNGKESQNHKSDDDPSIDSSNI